MARKKIHLSGICGTGMSAIAGMLKEKGYDVKGSDERVYPPISEILKDYGIEVYEGYKRENLRWMPDIVIIGNVIRKTNPEAEAVREMGIEEISMAEALRRFFLAGHYPLVVSGTHGKTTTASLLSFLLYAAGEDINYFIGGIPLNFGRNFRLGKGRFFVVEGDEYDTAYFDKTPKFWHYEPFSAIITNIEFDHADIYKNIDEIIAVFKKFAEILSENGFLIVSEKLQNNVLSDAKSKIVKTGFNNICDYSAKNIILNEYGSNFNLFERGNFIGFFHSPLYGLHNLENTLMALSLCIKLGFKVDKLKTGLERFQGVKKRLDIKGNIADVSVIEDFAHHPTAVISTIHAVRQRFGGRRIFALFEPESNTSRRRVFQKEYAFAFKNADKVFFTTPLEKKDNLKEEEKINMSELIEDIRKGGIECEMYENIDELAKFVALRCKPKDVLLILSGRDFRGLTSILIDELKKRFS